MLCRQLDRVGLLKQLEMINAMPWTVIISTLGFTATSLLLPFSCIVPNLLVLLIFILSTQIFDMPIDFVRKESLFTKLFSFVDGRILQTRAWS